MKLKPIALKLKTLKSNNTYWRSLWVNKITPEEEIKTLFKKISTTHAFPFERETAKGSAIVYDSIFSSSLQNGIISNGLREYLDINPDNDSTTRNIPSGLKNYVFSYLGIHQPYYAKKSKDKTGLLSKPFGIFIKTGVDAPHIEKFPHNHASRRDLGSNEVTDDMLEFLLPEDARMLMAYQICNDSDHKTKTGQQIDSFWHYYGDINCWSNADYALNSWKKKAEFRYFESVNTSDIAAILWPVWKDGEDDKYSITHDDFQKYSLLFPEIKFITYDLDLTDPEICFIEASYVALKYFLATDGTFPENISLAKDILDSH